MKHKKSNLSLLVYISSSIMGIFSPQISQLQWMKYECALKTVAQVPRGGGPCYIHIIG